MEAKCSGAHRAPSVTRGDTTQIREQEAGREAGLRLHSEVGRNTDSERTAELLQSDPRVTTGNISRRRSTRTQTSYSGVVIVQGSSRRQAGKTEGAQQGAADK